LSIEKKKEGISSRKIKYSLSTVKVFIKLIFFFSFLLFLFITDAIAGIFIRDISEGSVCARDGRLVVGDQIIEVNEQSLNGFSNVQALSLLQNTSSSVRLKVRRYLDGNKHDRIKEMIGKKFN